MSSHLQKKQLGPSIGPDRQKELLDIFDRLYRAFGPRHWWPAETPFEVCVGAILTQSVSWRNVERAIAALRQAGLLEPARLAAAPRELVESCIVPTLYYRVKARKLKAFVSHLMDKCGGDLALLFAGRTDDVRREVLGIWGIGSETADDMLLYAGGHPVFVVDAYTKRIFARLGGFDPPLSEKAPYAAVQEFFYRNLPLDVGLFNEYHALLDRLGNQVCLNKKPRCGECPLAVRCRTAWEESRTAVENPTERIDRTNRKRR